LPRRYEIEIAPTGYRSLKALKNEKLRREISKVIDGLARTPEDQGKALLEPLEGVRSVRVARGRFRILYKVDTRARLVSVLLVGERAAGQDADIYALAQKLLATLGRAAEDD
jgi:mRNA-degrading endonuclease RelE of RelBE toxin-antitoxin system